MKNTQQICVLLGSPVAHSLSPVMHNAAFKDKGLNYLYLAFDVKPANLKIAIEGLKALECRGMNITIPHKVSVVSLLDRLDPVSQSIGAVNTIVNHNGILKGYNTDAAGFLKALKDRNVDPTGKNVVILGAGGAAMAVAYILAKNGCSITIINRLARLGEAVKLAEKLSSSTGGKITALALNQQNLSTSLQNVHILINATSVGMYPKTGDSLVPAEMIKPEMVVFDLVYNPLNTRLLTEAALAGAQTVNGLEMLIWQGALAFELWTGLAAPVGIMRAEALKVINANQPAQNQPVTANLPVDRKSGIALIGFMGSGKTTVARILARKTGKHLVEMDKLIEVNAGSTISEIFASRGETAFRELEIEAAKDVSSVTNQVISCGGGIVLNQINLDRLRQNCVIVYLEVDTETLIQRMASQDVEKPVLKNTGNPDEIKALLAFRRPFYHAGADIIIDSTSLTPEETAEEIIKRLDKYAGYH